MKFVDRLSSFDKKLFHKRTSDGRVYIKRKSPFDKKRTHDILCLDNQYLGSGKWVIYRLMKMDTTRVDIIYKTLRHNWKLRDNKRDNRMHQEIADLIISGGSIVL